MAKKPYISIITVTAFSVIGFGASLLVMSSIEPSAPTISVASPNGYGTQPRLLEIRRLRQQIAERMLIAGPTSTLAEYGSKYAGAAYNIQHAIAHLFGELFYERYGVEGLAYCNDMSGYGCYHQFLGAALQGGLDALSDVDRACASLSAIARLQCHHGMGHGLLGFFGYSQEAILSALNICTQLGPDIETSCASGVFMENDKRFLLHSGTDNRFLSHPRPIEDDPLLPCPTMPARFQGVCYVQLPELWLKYYPKDASRIGAYCAGITGTSTLRSSCYYGAGKSIAWSANFDVDEILVLCRKLPSEGVHRCIGTAAMIAVRDGHNTAAGEKLCNVLTGPEERQICLGEVAHALQ